MAQDRVKAAQLLASFVSGGIERLMRSTAGPLQERRVDLTILTLNDQLDRAEDVAPWGVRVHPLSSHWRPIRYPLFPPASLRAELARIGREEDVQILHAHHYAAIAAAPMVARAMGVPFVVTHHAIGEPWQQAEGVRMRLLRMLMRRAMRRASRVFCWTPAVREDAERIAGCPLPRAQILELSIDDRFWSAVDPASTRELDVVMVGRLAPQKNVLFALDVFARLSKERPGFRAALVGGGPQEDEVLARRAALGLEEAVEMLGEADTEAILAVLNRAKVIFMPSRFEGLPAALVEALAMGLDAVVSDIPPLRAAFPDEPGVSFAPVGHLTTNVAALGAALGAKTLGPRPHLRARFDRASYCNKLAAAYREIAAG